MITTPADGLTAGAVKVKTKDGKEMDAYRAMPATGQGFGTILVVQEIFGVHAHIADICRRFAKAGYYAIAPELYFRQGDPKSYTEIPKLITEVVVQGAGRAGHGRPRLGGRLRQGRGQGRHRQARHHRLLLGRPHRVDVRRAQSGGEGGRRLVRPAGASGDATPLTPKNPVDIVKDLHGPVLGLYGGADTGIPQRHRRQDARGAEGRQRRRRRSRSIDVYPDTPHGFNADYRPSFRKDQAEDGWKKALAWFKANGVG